MDKPTYNNNHQQAPETLISLGAVCAVRSVPFILAALLRCGARLRKANPTELENDLTDRLRDKLDRDSVLRIRPIELFREVPLYDRKRSRQKQLGRTDLIFLYSTGSFKPWPYFVIETKRLHVTLPSGWKSLAAEYVTGRQGMMCFIDRRYARDLTEGAMLAYVFDGDVNKARDAVVESVAANPDKLKCDSLLCRLPSKTVAELSGIIESSHILPQGIFTIYHLFVKV
jgi:hypothetical protein